MADIPTLSERVAEEIRAMLARRRMSGRQLAEAAGMSQSAVSARLTGSTAIDLDDLQRIAAALDVDPLDLFPAEALEPGPVARGRGGRQLDGVQVSSTSRCQLQRRLGMKGMGLHRLRHWLLTRIQEEHGDLRLTQEIARHASPATTARYTMVADRRRVAAVRGVPALGPGASASMLALETATQPPPPE